MRRLVLAITGASGAIYGVRLLQILRELGGIETHLVVSRAAFLTLAAECDMGAGDVAKLAHRVHAVNNPGAPISSGSFRSEGMIVAPCSVRTASAIASGITDDLIARAADVMLKERRRLLVAIRETPLHAGHLETLTRLARLGAIIFPPVPAFYHRPQTLAEMVDQSCMRMLDQFGIESDAAPRWGEDGGVPAIGERSAAAGCADPKVQGGQQTCGSERNHE
ncbi:MAG: UbiX family flavin prenyltransferase [Geminicoccaceae bacterium]|nr:UbiX family flavin prenyltransferase [Geminicoccaceae bacterium]